MQRFNNISIVGLGRFGKTLFRLLDKEGVSFKVYDPSIDIDDAFSIAPNVKFVLSPDELYDSEQQIVFYAVPIHSFEKVIASHKQYIKPSQILVDVLSIKSHPKRVFESELNDYENEILLTHPMFGPDSSKGGFTNLPIVLDQFKTSKDTYNSLKMMFHDKGLKVVEMTAEEHDNIAANTQGVTHFVGRLLEQFEYKQSQIDTSGAKKLYEVMEQTCNDTWDLFRDLQTYNEFTADMRVRLGEAYDIVYNKLLPETVRKDKKLVFGIQGGRGSFNEQALSEYVKEEGIKDYEIKYLYTTERVLDALHRGEIDYGQFAIQNSIGGVVEETVHAMANYKFRIIKEFSIKIRHFLMKSSEADIRKIDTIMTHPQVLKQCKSTLKKKYPELKKTSGEGDLIDSANVARALSEGKLGNNIAVMGPEIMAKLFRLEVIEGDLQDAKDNVTSFMMVENIR